MDQEGNIPAICTEEYPFQYPKPGWVEQVPLDYWEGIAKATKHVVSASGILPNQIKGLVFTTQAMGIIPVTDQNEVIHNNISWVDGRAEQEANWIMNKLLGKHVFKSIVGIEITGKDVLPKLIWLKKNKPEIYNGTSKFLDVNGYLKMKATGKKVAEWSGACSYAFNLKKKDWEYFFFKLCGIDQHKLSDLVKSTDKVGTLTEDAAKQMGLDPGTPVYGGCDDTQSAAMGSGAIEEGQGHIYLGTSAWVGVMTKKAPKFKNGAVCLQSADPNKNLIVGINESAGANIVWFLEKFYPSEIKKGEAYAFQVFTDEVKSVQPGSEHLIFTPWMLGERCPASSTTTRSTIFNLSIEHGRAHMARAMLEGMAFNLRWVIENMEKDFGLQLEKLRITGGGSQNVEWMQIISNITKRTIITTNQPKMAGAIGAAMCAFVGSGVFTSFDLVHKFVQEKEVFKPNRDHEAIYDEMFSSYKDIYSSLKKTYKKANEKRFTN